MKFSSTLAFLAATAVSASPISPRQFGGSSTQNELQSGSCKDIIFIFARGSTETGNMGSTVGPPTCSGLKSQYGSDKVACQGVGGGYRASIADNVGTVGTSQAGLQEGTKMFELAQSKCPDSKVVASGYSQGAALIAGVITKLPAATKSQVKGVVLYGYTKNKQNNGAIPGYPKEQTKVFCNATDGVCGGGLTVTAGHLTYTADVNDAVKFLAGQIGS